MDPTFVAGMVAAGALLLLALVVLVFLLVWNGTMPAVFGLKRITYWQALGILVLASILTGSYRVITTDVANALKLLGM